MAIAAAVSAAELDAQVNALYVDNIYEARLIYAPGTVYQPGITNDATFLVFEVAQGTAGYERQTIGYVSGDVGTYADDGVALATKASVFAHDGGGTTLDFSHVVLVSGNGNVLTLGANTVKPTAAVNGTYTDIPVTTAGAGRGLTVDLVITNAGAALTDYAVTVKNGGTGYLAAEALQIPEATLVSIGAVLAGAGTLDFPVATVYSSSERILAVAQTAATVQLSAGNEAAFYWNLKQYSFTS